MLFPILLILLVLALFGGLPSAGFHNYGYLPSGTVLVVIIVLVFIFMRGR